MSDSGVVLGVCGQTTRALNRDCDIVNLWLTSSCRLSAFQGVQLKQARSLA